MSSAFSHLFLAGLLAGLFGSELQRHPTDFFPGGNATLLEPMNWIAVRLGQSLRHASEEQDIPYQQGRLVDL